MKLSNIKNSAITTVMALCAISLLLLPGCGAGPENKLMKVLGLAAAGGKDGSALISATAGGIVQLNDEVKLTVPANALADDTRITIERVKDLPEGDADGLSAFGQAYRFQPAGTTFDLGAPAILEMNYNGTNLALKGFNPETMQICYYDEALKCYVPVNCTVDTVHKKITAQVEHFTVYLPMAKALLPTNNDPYIGLQAPWPTSIRAGAPIYIRATVTDFDGSIAGVTLRYRKLRGAGAGVWHEARMMKEINPQATLHTYGCLIPASFLTGADLGTGNDIEYRIQATDNLGSVQTSAVRRYDVTLTYQAGSLNISPATLDIAAGFERLMTVRGVDSNNTTFSLVPETFTMASGSSQLENRFAQGIRLRSVTQTTTGSPDQLTVGFDGESASASVNVHAGEIESMEILDTNGLPFIGDLVITEGASYAFDVIGRDGYGNSSPILPVWSSDAGIGIIDTGGILDTTGGHGTGVVTASLGYTTDTQYVVVQSHEKEITSFSINGVDGVIVFPFITVTLPWGTDVTALVAQFTASGQSVTVDGNAQESGVTANDFTDPVVYRVTAEDGSSQDYTVQVRMLSPDKDITAFSINGISGTINDTIITVNLPSGTDITALVAIFTITGQNVAVNSVVQQSGVTANDFTNPLTYTVTAEDASVKDYTVTVTATLNACVDADLDDYGQNCAMGPDCDDTDPQVHPGAVEICDGIDNDCDGEIDEGFGNLGDQCFVGTGICRRQGFYACSADGSGTICSASPGEPTAETCDGLDNDCDGAIDENLARACYDGPSDTVDMGLCHAGTQTCSGGAWDVCMGQVLPVTEICDDYLDNDCDGNVDEICL